MDRLASRFVSPIEVADVAGAAAADISREARTNRSLLADVLTASGLVNYSSEWWHWSFGDRYWAFVEDRPNALYGPAYSLA
ncbi:M15 family metallopeptidase [Kribbella sp. NPDC051936]|uniref:M15 family metallopeptidase n=1 Tax=Kribbella sp. NPDC051936 TaxID=3154946 RepID=UPI0034457181